MVQDLLKATWWRFEHYDVDGLYIRPAPGAKLVPYDPWQQNRHGAEHAKNHEPPYITLARIGNERLHAHVTRRRSHLPGVPRVDADAAFLAAVREWSDQNGPLGLLLAGLEAFTTWPRYRPGAEPGPYWRDRTSVYPCARTYELSAGQWRSYDTELEEAELAKRWQAEEMPLSDQVEPERIERAFQSTSLLPLLPSPGKALCRNFQAIGGLSSWCLQPLSGWWTFFPSLVLGQEAFDHPEPLTDEFWRLHGQPPDTSSYDLPSPSSEEFWLHYAEPLDLFIRYADIFATALRGLQPTELDAWDAAMESAVGHATPQLIQKEPDADVETFRRLLSFVTPDMIPDPQRSGGYRAEWTSPTLLSTMAFMAYSDLVGGARVAYCRRNACSRVFLAHRDDQVYCSPRCKASQKKRCQRHPELLEETLKLHGQGLAIDEIASRLFLGEKRVAAWVAQEEKRRATEPPASTPTADQAENKGGT